MKKTKYALVNKKFELWSPLISSSFSQSDSVVDEKLQSVSLVLNTHTKSEKLRRADVMSSVPFFFGRSVGHGRSSGQTRTTRRTVAALARRDRPRDRELKCKNKSMNQYRSRASRASSELGASERRTNE